MFAIDYEHQLSDHGKVLILVRNFDPQCSSVLFDQAFLSISVNHSTVYPRRGAIRHPRSHFADPSKDSPPGFQLDQATIQPEDSAAREQAIWLRYVRDYNSFNSSWAAFQSHRAVLGLIGLCCCSSHEDVISAIQAYLRQKALISEHPVNGRLFILVPNDSILTVEQINEVNKTECQKLLHSLLLTETEVVAHPMDQFFNTQLHSQDSTSLPVSPTTALFHFLQPQPSPKTSQALILNNRIVRSLSDMVSEVCINLEKVINTIDPQDGRRRRLSLFPSAGLEAPDVDGSESVFSAATAPVDLKNTGNSTESTGSEDRLFSMAPLLNLIPSDMTSVTGSQPQSPDSSGSKQRRTSGRWKKHLADIALQLGELELAQLYYDTASQLLRPLGDSLWVAGTIEGLCALSVIRNMGRPEVSEFSTNLKAPSAASYTERHLSKSADFSDLAVQKLGRTHPLFTMDYVTNLTEALELYKKVGIDERVLEETTVKFARLFVAEKQTEKSIELLDSLLSDSSEDKSDLHIPMTQRLNALIKLYCEAGCYRRACYAAWKSIERSLRLPTETEFDVLFRHLRVRVISSSMWSDHDPFTPYSSVNGVSELSAFSLGTASKQPTLQRPAIPSSICPVVIQHKAVWFHGASGQSRGRLKLDHSVRSTRSARSQLRALKSASPLEQFTFQATGWSSLQAAVIQHLLAVYKSQVSFEDAEEISWECGLHLIGMVFSLLDHWPSELDKQQCTSAMEDLCRLAILRSPDQPTVLRPLFETDGSGSVNFWLKSSPSMTSPRDVVKQRQFVDLVEVPVHQLPVIRSINLIELPSYLIPRAISKAALATAVAVSPSDVGSVKSEAEICTRKYSGQSGLFLYAPPDSSSKQPKVVDWVCQETVDLELMVDNPLPVDLRISDMRVELLRIPSFTQTPPPEVSPPKDMWLSDPLQPIVQLEVVRLAVDKPIPKARRTSIDRSRSVDLAQATFTMGLNQACVLEAAQDRFAHPYATVDPNWRRQRSIYSCTLPANSLGLRLIITVRPNAAHFFPDMGDAPPQFLYRVIGLTYRLVDFGGMHVCFRVPHSLLSDEPIPAMSTTRNQASTTCFSNSSSPAASTISMLRSSLNSEVESVQPSSDSVIIAEHPTFAVVKSVLSLLPIIRIFPTVPRLYVLPGIVRSAHNLKEAAEFLPSLTIPSSVKSKNITEETSPHIQLPRFRLPLGNNWSENTACMLEISIYPYEIRWLPLRLVIRDEAREISAGSDSVSFAPHLNAFHVRISASRDSKAYLKKLNLNAEDFVQCVNADALHKKLPLSVQNEEVFLSQSCGTTMTDEPETTGLHATDFGLLWLCFQSEKYWKACCEKRESFPNESFFRVSRKIHIEVSFEYAAEVATADSHQPLPGPTTTASDKIARLVTFAFSIHLLSSKHAPMILYHPQLAFQDPPFENMPEDQTEHTFFGTHEDNLLDAPSKSFFYCTLRARLPASLVPRPIRHIHHQYRVSLELSHAWRSFDPTKSHAGPIAIQTPWTALSDSPTSQAETPTSPPFCDLPMMAALEDARCIEQPDEDSKDDTSAAGILYQYVVLALERLSDVVFPKKQEVHVVNEGVCRTDEISLPIPADTQTLVRCLEDNINIMWKSHLHGRVVPGTSERHQHTPLPDPRFYRFGRFMLAAHSGELAPKERLNQSSTSRSRRSSLMLHKPWYGAALSTQASIVGLLWCHTIKIDIRLTQIAVDASHQICRQNLGPSLKQSAMSRRLSTPSGPYSPLYRNMSHKSRTSQAFEERLRQVPRSRHLSTPEFNPRHFQGMNTSLLSSAYRICVEPFEPLNVTLRAFISEHPLKNLVFSDTVTTASMSVKMIRVWAGPVVYEIYQKPNLDARTQEDPVPVLSPPLVEGKDYACIGNLSGTMGLMLPDSKPNWLSQCSQIMFYRPGRYWVCGLMGIVPSDLALPSIDAADQSSIHLPNHDNVETIRFTPSGITVHVHETKLS